jgi:hypothetical protein
MSINYKLSVSEDDRVRAIRDRMRAAKTRVETATVVSIGDLARVQMLAREMFKAAILANASGLILGHNHPAPSSSEPSPQDVRATKGLIGAGSILGIDVLDHIIVTTSDTDFFSMRERGLLSIFWGDIAGRNRKDRGVTNGSSRTVGR